MSSSLSFSIHFLRVFYFCLLLVLNEFRFSILVFVSVQRSRATQSPIQRKYVRTHTHTHTAAKSRKTRSRLLFLSYFHLMFVDSIFFHIFTLRRSLYSAAHFNDGCIIFLNDSIEFACVCVFIYNFCLSLSVPSFGRAVGRSGGWPFWLLPMFRTSHAYIQFAPFKRNSIWRRVLSFIQGIRVPLVHMCVFWECASRSHTKRDERARPTRSWKKRESLAREYKHEMKCND